MDRTGITFADNVSGESLVIRALRPYISRRALLTTLACAASLTACAGATTRASELAVRQVWNEYLSSKNGQFAANAGTPSPLWSTSEQAQWPMYDLAGFYLPDESVPEVLRVTPVDPAVDSAYQIVTQFWPSSPATRDSSTKPVLTMTVYARREGGRWVLANALPFLTETWVRETRGRIAYRVAPTLCFDSTKAVRATAMPNARLLELKGIGHFPYVEAPEVFFAAVDRFLRGEWPEGATR